MNGPILGWDVGGANVKAARLPDGDASHLAVLERPFALWREPGRLPEVLHQAAADLGPALNMAVTMTAELADCFATKREGVAFVLAAFRGAFPEARHWVYGVDGRFHSIEAARRRPRLIAAANWMASATLVACASPRALFIDVGSTTTDVIPIAAGRVAARGRSDPGRLRTGELVYTGALRTPVCAIVRAVPLRGRRCPVAAEHFAVAADVHRWLGGIEERDYTCETPDGRGRSREEAGARLARMVCADREALADDDITGIADHIARAQVRQIVTRMRQVLRHMPDGAPPPVILAGRGAFLARAAANELGLESGEMASRLGPGAALVAPAAAVACLLAKRPED